MSVDTPRVTVVVPCRNERRHIAACLDSILATTYPLDRLEVLVADGRSDDGTAEIVRRYLADDRLVRLIDNPGRGVPSGLNAAIGQAAGEVIVRMDAHAEYPRDYIPRLVAWLERSGADNVGGACVTRPADDSPMARAIAAAVSHRLGVGNARFRLGTVDAVEVDTVPFGCFRRELFGRIGLFDEELVRNQDDELNHRILRHGGRVLLVPDVVSYYYARPRWGQLARTYFQYGYFKPLAIRKLGRVTTLRCLAPAALTATLLAGGLLAPWLGAPRPALALLVGTYLGTLAVVAGSQARRLGGAAALRLPLAFGAMHFGYGIGFLLGAARLVRSGGSRWTADRVPLSH